MSKKLLGKNVWNSMNDKDDQILNDPVLVQDNIFLIKEGSINNRINKSS